MSSNWIIGTSSGGANTPTSGGGGGTSPGGGNADFWKRPQLVPAPGKCGLGYYDRTQNPVAFEARWGRKVDSTILYDPWSLNSMSFSQVSAQIARGTIPRVDITFRAYEHALLCKVEDLWWTISTGAFDADGSGYLGIDTMAKNLMTAMNGQPIWVSFNHEGDGSGDGGGDTRGSNGFYSSGGTRTRLGRGGVTANGGPQTASDYRAMCRHVIGRFRSIAATFGLTEPVWFFNMQYVNGVDSSLSPNGKPIWGNALTDTDSDGMYPGHNYVDWVGWDPYNYASSQKPQWRSFRHLLSLFNNDDWWFANFKVGGARTNALAAPGQGVYKPIHIGETGTSEYWANLAGSYSGHTSTDGTARDWMNGMADTVLNPTSDMFEVVKWIQWLGVDYAGTYAQDGFTVTNIGYSVPPTSMISIGDTRIVSGPESTQKWAGLLDLAGMSGFQVRV